MKYIKYVMLVLGIVFLSASIPVNVNAVSACDIDPNSAICKSSGDTVEGFLKSGINLLLYVLGAVAVIMIIVGGIYYVISGGDSAAITKAKNTILYSVVGLIVALLAYAIVNFVISRFVSAPNAGVLTLFKSLV
ncbi:MAG: hypothetical protein PWQ10_432 [Patescibacteria group bacterium]|nr:hypothetical protein [Patescibacteria group bacterium]